MAKCHATAKTTGEPCKRSAIPGGTVCDRHGGKAPQVAARAAIIATVARWQDGMTVADPGDTLLRLMTVALLRAQQHADELDKVLAEQGWGHAFVGDAYGEFGKVGEYARQLAVWESTERKHAADLAVKAVAAGLEERQVRAREREVDLFASALDAALADAGLAAHAGEVKGHVARRLRLIAS